MLVEKTWTWPTWISVFHCQAHEKGRHRPTKWASAVVIVLKVPVRMARLSAATLSGAHLADSHRNSPIAVLRKYCVNDHDHELDSSSQQLVEVACRSSFDSHACYQCLLVSHLRHQASLHPCSFCVYTSRTAREGVREARPRHL